MQMKMKLRYFEQDLHNSVTTTKHAYLEVEALDNKNWGIAIAANSAASGPDTFIIAHDMLILLYAKLVVGSTLLSYILQI